MAKKTKPKNQLRITIEPVRISGKEILKILKRSPSLSAYRIN
jgi:hypothetical protein